MMLKLHIILNILSIFYTNNFFIIDIGNNNMGNELYSTKALFSIFYGLSSVFINILKLSILINFYDKNYYLSL